MNDLTSDRHRVRSSHELSALAEKVALTQDTVLIAGQDDDAKEQLARRIHGAGPRRSGVFVVADLACVAESLVEQELFGQEQGGSTGTGKSATGLLELANGGTLFVREISAISELVQIKLLRALREQRFVRLGGKHPIAADVRLVAGTASEGERDLAGCVFRKDLYCRHNVICLVLPQPGHRSSSGRHH